MAFLASLLGGGGGSKSTTTNSMITSTAVSAISNNIMSCSGNQMMSQEFTVSGNGNSLSNIKQIQSLQLSTSCAQSSQNIASLQQQVTSALEAAASVNTQAVLSAFSASSSSDVNTKIQNDVKQNITQNTILKIINDTNAQQKVIISGNANVINNFTQEQTASILNNNIQNAINSMASVQTISGASKATSKNTQSNPLDDMLKTTFSGVNSLADTIGGVFSSGMYTIAAVIIVGMVVVGYFFGPTIIAMLKGGPLGMLFDLGDDDAGPMGIPVGLPPMGMPRPPPMGMPRPPPNMQPRPQMGMPNMQPRPQMGPPPNMQPRPQMGPPPNMQGPNMQPPQQYRPPPQQYNAQMGPPPNMGGPNMQPPQQYRPPPPQQFNAQMGPPPNMGGPNMQPPQQYRPPPQQYNAPPPQQYNAQMGPPPNMQGPNMQTPQQYNAPPPQQYYTPPPQYGQA